MGGLMQIEPQPTTNGANGAPPVQDFSKIVQESRKKIAIDQTAPLKRPVGRPRKTPISESQTEARPSVAAPAPPQPPPDIVKYLKTPLMAIGQIPARRTGIDELALNEEEATLCANALQEILNAFIPDLSKMSPKTAAVFSGVLTFGSIALQKYGIYQAKIAEAQAQLERESAQGEKPPQAPSQQAGSGPVVTSMDYFKVQKV